MATQKVADFFAQFSIRVDQRKINAFEKQLNKIEQKLLSIQKLNANSLKAAATAVHSGTERHRARCKASSYRGRFVFLAD